MQAIKPFRFPYRIVLALNALLMIVMGSCVTLPETGKSVLMFISPQQEADMGTAAFAEVKKTRTVSKGSAENEQVQRVAGRLIEVVDAPYAAKWEIIVFDDDTPNAFALPGGKIGVHKGILAICQNDAGLAAVIGHELAHVTLRHGGQRVSQQLLILGGATIADAALAMNKVKERRAIMAGLGVGAIIGFTLPYSREHEYEADRIGMKYMAKAGYNPKEAIELWKRMRAHASKRGVLPEFLSTHPADDNRIRRMQAFLPEAMFAYNKKKDQAETSKAQ